MKRKTVKRKEVAMHSPAGGEVQRVMTLDEARLLIRATSDEAARHWLKTYASGALLPGSRLRVSRARLLAIIDGRLPAGPPEITT